MQISKAPFRISFFGGGTDSEIFYKQHGSLIIGTTIDKHVFVSVRKRPSVVSDFSIISYSKQEIVENFQDIQNPLIRETVLFSGIQEAIDLHSFSDIPSRVGLGGSSSYTVALLHALRHEFNLDKTDSKVLAKDAIRIEREILKDFGGIQDQIWAAHGGFNKIEIDVNGNFSVKSMPLSEDFLQHLEKSMILVYTQEQRNTNQVASYHDSKDKDQMKREIFEIAQIAYRAFENQNISAIGKLLKDSWESKKAISGDVSTAKIDEICQIMKTNSALGWKLCGAGGGGFVVGIAHPHHIQKMKEIFNKSVLEFKFDKKGVQTVYGEQNAKI